MGAAVLKGRATVKKKDYSGYLFILPIIILFLIFIVYPICYNFVISFFEWNGINIEKLFVGFDNYKTCGSFIWTASASSGWPIPNGRWYVLFS